MKKLVLLFLISIVIYSCSKSETTPPVVNKVNGCDSIKQGLLKTTNDTIRLLSCLSISGCDSVRLGVLKPNTQDTIRLLSCIKITGCDSVRLGVLKPNTQDTLRLLSCIKISANDSMRLGLIKIGQKFQGGIVAYFLQPGDPGYDAKIKRGLIAATSDASVNKVPWAIGLPTPNALIYLSFTGYGTDTAIGAGLVNTNKIITIQGGIPDFPATRYAAGLARAHNGGGFNDWFLPSKNELNKLFLNKDAIGGFKTEGYWSSSESARISQGLTTYPYAWIKVFYNLGLEGSPDKESSYYVRAIRAF